MYRHIPPPEAAVYARESSGAGNWPAQPLNLGQLALSSETMDEVAIPTAVVPGPSTVMSASKQPRPRPPLSILHVHSGNLFGGIEHAILTLAENLHLVPSIEFEFALCFDGQFSQQLMAAGQAIHKLPAVRTRNPLSILAARRHLARLLKQKQYYDVVLCHSPWTHSIFSPAIRRSRIPELFWAHDRFTGKHWLEKWAGRSKPNWVISNSNYSDESVTQMFPGIPHQVLRCPVPTSRVRLPPELRSHLRAELNTPEDAVVIIQVSRMESWKGHDLLLETAATMGGDSRWIIWFVGGRQRKQEETYIAALEAKAKSLGISDRVRFAGQRPDVPRLLAAADIFCQPNRSPEPFGLVFVEALSQALPVVTFAMGGPGEIVDKSCGVLVPPGRMDALALHLHRLILDRELRRKLGEAGPARAKALCDPAMILTQFETLVSELSATKWN
jgi:glycosyltransferase involved in cell wall biosynthesis